MWRLACLGLIGCGRHLFDPVPVTGTDDAMVPGDTTVRGDTAADAPPDAPPDADPIAMIAGLVAHYPLDEAAFSGMAADASGGDRPALCMEGVNCPEPAAGVVGGAALFDGNSERLRVPYAEAFATTSGFTIAVFAYPTTFNGGRTIFTKPHEVTATANSWQLQFAGASSPRFKTRGAIVDDEELFGPSLPLDTWSHLAGTWDGSTMRLYVNGSEVASIAFTNLLLDTSDLLIGCDENGGSETNFFQGRIDDVRLYDRALTPTEISLLANQ